MKKENDLLLIQLEQAGIKSEMEIEKLKDQLQNVTFDLFNAQNRLENQFVELQTAKVCNLK